MDPTVPETQLATTSPGATEVRLSQVVSALSYALDLTEGQPQGHAVRSAIIGMRLADEISLPEGRRSALYYALLLKDLGCSSNAAKVCALFQADDHAIKQGMKTIDWVKLGASARYVAHNVAPGKSWVKRALRFAALGRMGPKGSQPLFEIRCERGARIARLLGFSEDTAQAILGLDEHWNGKGHPRGIRGAENPLLARILGLAQTAEVFHHDFGLDAMMTMAHERSGKWFDPELVHALLATRHDHRFWDGLEAPDLDQRVLTLEPRDHWIMANGARLDRIAAGFAQVIDAKSPWTFRHSEGVAELAVGTGFTLGLDHDRLRTLNRAALLHDVGKLGVSNLILDKSGKLTDDAWCQMKQHAVHTRDVLDRIDCFREFSAMASAHHEKLDGTGYPWGLKADQISLETRVLTVADIYEALSAKRPYRPRLDGAEVLEIMGRDVGQGLCPAAFEALKVFVQETGWMPKVTINHGTDSPPR